MIITVEWLMAHDACEDGLRWFKEHFGSSVDLDTLVAALRYEWREAYFEWLVEELALTKTYKTSRLTIPFVNGVRHGTVTETYASGNPCRTSTWVNGNCVDDIKHRVLF